MPTDLTAATRPVAHFAADTWMNDPNGLVHVAGVYHLFYQANPWGQDWATMSWGHAVSTDLVTWRQLPTAIEATEHEHVYSGSAVLDTRNTSGLGVAGRPPVVALYTGVATAAAPRPGIQAQCLAYSVDDGMTWTRYEHNPVLDIGSTWSRDPKVFRYGGDDGHWVMVLVLAEERQVALYTSADLIHWEEASRFGPAGAPEGIWECPDLIPVRVAGTDEERWVLVLSINPGGPAGGSGTQYFVGDFDGTTFTVDPGAPDVGSDWLDHGPDCYAGVTFSDVPDGRRLLIAWADNWRYAHDMPRPRWRPLMTLARELDLVAGPDGRLRLRQRPVLPAGAVGPDPGPTPPLAPGLKVLTTEVPTTGATIRVVLASGEELRIEVADGVLTSDRTGTGGPDARRATTGWCRCRCWTGRRISRWWPTTASSRSTRTAGCRS